jgi:hypothetical protein
MSNTNPGTRARIQEAITRNEYARRIIAGFRSDMPTLATVWDYLEDALNDVLILDALLKRLAQELEQTRVDRANLRAAIRATLAAHADAEPDPFWYLRDELDAIQPALSRSQAMPGSRP